jgi:acetyl esterase
MSPTRAAEPHPQVRRFLSLYDSLDVPDFSDIGPAEARELFEQLYTTDPDIDIESIEDRTVDSPAGDVPVRVYDPGTAGEDRPLVVYAHGGGWVIGSIDTHDGTCRKLAATTGYPVVSVDYRLAPEHPFPAGLRDYYAALGWAREAAPEFGADPGRLVVAGDSAGGNLAAAAALLARDHGGPAIAHQLLVYPVTGDATATESYTENAEGYFLTAEQMGWFRAQYFASDIDEGNTYALPRRAADLSGLPPATVLTAGFDPLRDDGAAYVDRLADAGVPVEHYNYDDLIHGFFSMISEPVDLDGAHAAYDEAALALQTALEAES